MEKTGVYGSHKQRQSHIFGFSMTEKEDCSKKKKKAGAEGTTQEVTLNTHF